MRRDLTSEINLDDLEFLHPESAIHSYELAYLASIMGPEIRLPKSITARFVKAAGNHDGGKATVARTHYEILAKPERLTESEFEEGIKPHAEIGFWRLALHEDPVMPILAYIHHMVKGADSYPRSQIDFTHPESNVLIPDFDSQISRGWIGALGTRVADRMLKASQDPEIREIALLLVDPLAALDASQASWGHRKYLNEDKLSPAQRVEERRLRWTEIRKSHSGNKQTLDLAMQIVTWRYKAISHLQSRN